MDRAVVVLSGGQDSATCLAWACEEFDEVEAISFEYGQRHKIELECAKKLSELAGVHHKIITGVPFNQVSRSNLFEGEGDVNEPHPMNSNLPSSFVPGRNLVFLTFAASYAYNLGITNIVTGVTTSDFWNFKPITWDWLAGFFEAEGWFSRCVFSGRSNTFIPVFGLCQNDLFIIKSIKDFIDKSLPNIVTHITDSKTKNGTSFTLSIKYEKNIIPLVKKLVPKLKTKAKRDQYVKIAKEFDLPQISFSDKLNWDWVLGFWEGDGGISKHSYQYEGFPKVYYPAYMFWQKDRNILDRIISFLDKGSVSKRNSGSYSLTVSDGNIRRTIYPKFNNLIRMKKSREKLSKIYVELDTSEDCYKASYPDCSPEFIYSVQKTLRKAFNSRKFEIHTPLQYKTKAETVLMMKELGKLDWYKDTHTCYKRERPPCGKCPACKLRAKGFDEAGIADPLL